MKWFNKLVGLLRGTYKSPGKHLEYWYTNAGHWLMAASLAIMLSVYYLQAISPLILAAIILLFFLFTPLIYVSHALRLTSVIGILVLSVEYIFLALPMIFASLYSLFQSYFSSGCVSGLETSSIIDALYFSYTTHTTLGYGDMSPVGFCKIITSFQALLGYIGLGVCTAAFFLLIGDRARRFENQEGEILYYVQEIQETVYRTDKFIRETKRK